MNTRNLFEQEARLHAGHQVAERLVVVRLDEAARTVKGRGAGGME